MASGARFFRTVCKSDASTGDGATEPQRKYRSSCSFFSYRECSCPHGSATIKISLISFRRLKLENPLQFSLLRASFLLVFSASLAVPPPPPTSFSRKDSPRGANRDRARNKRDETPGCSFRFLERGPPRNSRILSIRELVW